MGRDAMFTSLTLVRLSPLGILFPTMTVKKDWICVCDVCGHRWLAETKELPKRCANNDCRSRRWNHKEKK
jgi:hypothetical protein